VNILVVKHGALGDVVRTSYFAGALRRKWGKRLRLSWLTAPASLSLIRFHPDIDDVFTSFEEAKSLPYDRIYSLDDEREVLEGVARLDAASISGAFVLGGVASYSDDSASWFDMGLLSRYGKDRADELKKLNRRGHAEIFCEIFDVPEAVPVFHGNPRLERCAAEQFNGSGRLVGINPFAGGRWPSKELRLEELRDLVSEILKGGTVFGPDCRVVMFGAGADHQRNLELAAEFPGSRILVPNTDDSILRLAAVIRQLDTMITSDSLAMHLAISQDVPTLAFFAPTSADEIDDFGRVAKVVSTAADYCSYRKDADNRSITCEAILKALSELPPGKASRVTGARRADMSSGHLPTYCLFQVIVDSEQQFRDWTSKAASEIEFRRRLEASLSEGLRDEETRVHHGYCFVCGRHAHMLFDLKYSNNVDVNWRERLVCTGCGLSNRLRLAIHALALHQPEWMNARIYLTEQLTPLAHALSSRCSSLVCSEFLGPDVPPGSYDANGTRHEDLTRLSFHSGSFDAVLSFDVLEHVPDYLSALREIRRVLQPGGLLLLSVPFHLGSASNIVRARLDERGGVVHLMEPEYHGDPVSEQGILCFYHFGWQLLDEIRTAGFSGAEGRLYWSSDYGYIGGEQLLVWGIA
jgi:heptosyltransferase-2